MGIKGGIQFEFYGQSQILLIYTLFYFLLKSFILIILLNSVRISYTAGKMKNLIPEFILHRLRENTLKGEIDSYTVFIDMSGFTRMSQDLMKYEKEGSELLCSIINRVFTEAIDSVHNNGGFITTFAGDAFTAVFDKREVPLPCVLKACTEISKKITGLGDIETEMGNFPVSVKIGISEGIVKWGILKTDANYSFYFRGEGIDNAAFAEHQARRNDIILDKRILKNSREIEDHLHYLPKRGNYARLIRFDHTGCPKRPAEKADSGMIRHFVPDSVSKLKAKGEFRELLSMFLTFRENEGFLEGIAKAINLSKIYGAYLKQIDFGDKGGTLLFFFGAPVAMEKPFDRAAEFSLECLRINELSCRIALTYGRAFAGFIGSTERCEYGALGNVVNKSARINMVTDWNSISADKIVYSRIKDRFIAELTDSRDFKGFYGKLDYYRIIRKMAKRKKVQYRGKIFARDKELSLLSDRIKALNSGKFGGLIYINGDPGIGKTRLIWELKKNLDEKELYWVYMPCDPILKNSFNPVKYFLRNFFDCSDELDNEINKRSFESKIDLIMGSIDDEYLKKELDRTKPLTGSLAGISFEGSLFSSMSSKTRHENTIYSLKNLIKALSMIKPVVIELDDGQWIDPETHDFLGRLVENLEDHPILILSECRYQDNGERFSFNFKGIGSCTNSIDLEYFDKETIRSFILDFYSIEEVTDETVEYIFKYSSGNPFFLEQILSFIQENSLIDKKGSISREKIRIPSDINSLIIARIDRLSEDLKELIKTASVLGIEFPVKILQSMLSGERIDDKIKKVEDEQIWIPFTRISYLFRHMLIRESVYQIQLRETLRKLHSLAAKTITEIYADDLEPQYPALANHYEKAENTEEAVKYIRLSIKSFKKQYQNKKALEYYDRLLRYIEDPEEKMNIKLSRMTLLNETGRLNDSLSLGLEVLEDAQERHFEAIVPRACLNLGIVSNLLFKLDEAVGYFMRILEPSSKCEDKNLIASAYQCLGKNYHHRGYDDQALVYFQKALDIYKEINDSIGIANCYNDIAIFCGRQAGLDRVLDYLFRAYDIFKKEGDINFQLIPLSNIGLTYFEVYLDLERSNSYYEKAVDIAERTGNYRTLQYLYLNLSSNYCALHDYGKAYDFIMKAIHYCQEMNDRDNLSQCYIGLGEIYYQQKEYDRSLEYIDRAISITKTHKNMNLRLIDQKFAKIIPLIDLKRYQEAYSELSDIKRLYRQFDIKSLKEYIRIYEFKIKHLMNFKTALKNMKALLKDNLCSHSEALVLYILWQFTGDEKYRTQALGKYRELVDGQADDYKSFQYTERVKELEDSASAGSHH